jgi:putative transposase
MYRRNLPHWYPEGTAVFVTWRLQGTLPRGKELPGPSDGGAFRKWDRDLDGAKFGPSFLNQSEVAACVQQTIFEAEGQGGLCKLHSFVVMPNHVHVVLTPKRTLWEVTKWMKGASARRANLILNRTGTPFWQDESFDHWVRSQAESGLYRNRASGGSRVAGSVSPRAEGPCHRSGIRATGQAVKLPATLCSHGLGI